jgi:hypothetical protein
MASAFFLLYAVVLGIALGFAIGFVSSRSAPGGQFSSAVGYGLAGVLVLSVVVYAGARLGGDVAPRINGSRIDMQLELRAPAGWKLTNGMRSMPGWLRLASTTETGRERNSTDGSMEVRSARVEEGRTVIPGEVFVYTSKGRRSVEVRMGGEAVAAFQVPLPGKPDEAHLQWSAWLPAGEGGFEFRFRVKRLEDEAREKRAQEAAWKQSYDKLTPESPIEDYLAHLSDPEFDVRNQAIRVVGQRVTELIPLLESPDRNRMELALSAAARSNPLPASFEQPLLGVLKGILRDLRSLRETEATDPDKVEADAVKGRFINWFTSWRNCHQGPAVIPEELRELIRESEKFDRRRLEEAANIAPLARRYIGEWSGRPSGD